MLGPLKNVQGTKTVEIANAPASTLFACLLPDAVGVGLQTNVVYNTLVQYVKLTRPTLNFDINSHYELDNTHRLGKLGCDVGGSGGHFGKAIRVDVRDGVAGVVVLSYTPAVRITCF